MSLTYAIPDIHGRLDLLESAIDKIVEHSSGRTRDGRHLRGLCRPRAKQPSGDRTFDGLETGEAEAGTI